MDMTKLMLDLLNNDCRNFVYDEHGERIKDQSEHRIALHCLTAIVQVRVVSRDAEGLPDNYEILSVKWEDS